mmetsp:Transcript_3800/g.13329  ORF Transcript_3800/g.13329 Transcript_3800/m.13329 type:complete len:201 (-) Transcript_3800:2165-2767(-)
MQGEVRAAPRARGEARALAFRRAQGLAQRVRLLVELPRQRLGGRAVLRLDTFCSARAHRLDFSLVPLVRLAERLDVGLARRRQRGNVVAAEPLGRLGGGALRRHGLAPAHLVFEDDLRLVDVHRVRAQHAFHLRLVVPAQRGHVGAVRPRRLGNANSRRLVDVRLVRFERASQLGDLGAVLRLELVCGAVRREARGADLF